MVPGTQRVGVAGRLPNAAQAPVVPPVPNPVSYDSQVFDIVKTEIWKPFKDKVSRKIRNPLNGQMEDPKGVVWKMVNGVDRAGYVEVGPSMVTGVFPNPHHKRPHLKVRHITPVPATVSVMGTEEAAHFWPINDKDVVRRRLASIASHQVVESQLRTNQSVSVAETLRTDSRWPWRPADGAQLAVAFTTTVFFDGDSRATFLSRIIPEDQKRARDILFAEGELARCNKQQRKVYYNRKVPALNGPNPLDPSIPRVVELEAQSDYEAASRDHEEDDAGNDEAPEEW
jgi:hypothetical protein